MIVLRLRLLRVFQLLKGVLEKLVFFFSTEEFLTVHRIVNPLILSIFILIVTICITLMHKFFHYLNERFLAKLFGLLILRSFLG